MKTAPLATEQLITVKSIVLHRVRVPLLEPFRISNGSIAEKEAILIEVLSGDGHVGWGEASPMIGSFYSGDTPDSVWNSLTTSLIPEVLNAGEIDVSHFYETLRAQCVDSFARAGIEGALWDICARKNDVSLNSLLGGRTRPFPSGVAIGIYDDIGGLLERVERYTAQGYRRVKIKIEPGWDVKPVTEIRSRFPELSLMVDANAAYSLIDLAMFQELDTHGLMMIEQPLARNAYEEAGELQRRLRTPLCADESADSLEALGSRLSTRLLESSISGSTRWGIKRSHTHA